VKLTRSYRKGIGRVYIDEDKREYPSVTTILNGTLAKGIWLGKWQDRMRREQFHARVEVESLKGLTTENVYDCFDDALAHPNNYRDAAGDVGTFYHKAIEAHLTDNDTTEFLIKNPNVEGVLSSLYEWECATKLTPIHVEQYIASPRYGYGGTIDLVGTQDKTLALFDFKTGSLQDDALLQLAAYSMAYQEIYGRRPDKTAFIKVDVAKGTIKEAPPLSYHEISQYFDLFLSAFKLWKWRQLKQFGG
jgi:hypothetical protein